MNDQDKHAQDAQRAREQAQRDQQVAKNPNPVRTEGVGRTDGAAQHEAANKLNLAGAQADAMAHEPSYLNVSPNAGLPDPVGVASANRLAAASKVDLSQWIQNLRGIHSHEAGMVAVVRSQYERLSVALEASKALGATDEQLLPVYAELDAFSSKAEVIARAFVENP